MIFEMTHRIRPQITKVVGRRTDGQMERRTDNSSVAVDALLSLSYCIAIVIVLQPKIL